MSKPTGPTNPQIKGVIEDIRSKGYKEKLPFLIEISKKLETSRRKRAEVNLSKLDRVSKEKETVIVPGKVLSAGILRKPIIVAAASFSMSAVDKIEKAGGKTMSIDELVKQNPRGKDVRIVI